MGSANVNPGNSLCSKGHVKVNHNEVGASKFPQLASVLTIRKCLSYLGSWCKFEGHLSGTVNSCVDLPLPHLCSSCSVKAL